MLVLTNLMAYYYYYRAESSPLPLGKGQQCFALIGLSVAPPALLCHKEPAQGTKSPLLGKWSHDSLWQKVGFYARKGYILEALTP